MSRSARVHNLRLSAALDLPPSTANEDSPANLAEQLEPRAESDVPAFGPLPPRVEVGDE